jgi:hypothetical protein
MNSLAQNLAVLMIVGGCIAYVGWQLFMAFRGRKSKLGSCCAKGCEAVAADSKASPKSEPVHFLPLENLGRGSRKV